MNKKGFTLIEVVMIIVILGIIMPGIMLYFITGVKDSAIPQKRTTAVFLAEALVEEIKSKGWDETASISNCSTDASSTLGFEVGEGRLTYDDVDDFNGLNNTPIPQNSQGANMTDYQGYGQSVAVMYVNSGDLDTDAATRTCYKRIAVTITDTTTNESIELVTLRTSY